MAWGNPSNKLTSHITRITQNDPTLTSLYILPSRRVEAAEFTKLFTALGQNTKLQELHLSGHKLLPEALEALSQALRTNSSILRINIGDESLANCEGWSTLCQSVAASASIIEWDCTNKGISKDSVADLSPLLTKETKLQRLNLSGNKIDDEALSTLLNQISLHLRSLDMSYNELHSIGSLLEALENKDCQLEELSLSNNTLTPDGAAKLGQKVANNKTLIRLDVSGCACGDYFLQGMSNFTSGISQLETVNLSETGTTDDGLRFLAPAVSALPLCQILLQKNSLTDKAVQNFCQHCTRASSNLELDFSDNSLGDQSLEALLQLAWVRKLRFFGNRLTMNFHNDFQHSKLEILDISCCNIKPSDLSSFLSNLELPNFPVLSEVEIGGNAGMEGEDLATWQNIMANFISRPTINFRY